MEGHLRKIQAKKEKEGMMQKEEILEYWFSELIRPLPCDKRDFLQKAGDRFLNPLRSQLREGLEELLDGLLSDNRKCLEKGLALIMSLFAIEDIKPSEAVSFIPKIKGILKGHIEEKKIEETVFLGFDTYMHFREKLYELKIKERRFHIEKGHQ